MNKEKIQEIFKETFIAIERFKQNRIKLALNELLKNTENDEAMNAITELWKAYSQAKATEEYLKNGIPKIEEEKKNDKNTI